VTGLVSQWLLLNSVVKKDIQARVWKESTFIQEKNKEEKKRLVITLLPLLKM